MGKIKKKRSRAVKFNPIAAPLAAENDTDGGEVHQSDVISTLVDQLKSACVEDRVSGCDRFASPALSLRLSVQLLRQHRLVWLIGPLLVDPAAEVRKAAAAALRNLSVTAGREGCDVMVQQDVLSSLFTALSKFTEPWKARHKTEQGETLTDAHTDLFIHLVHLLWNLCESSEKAVQVFNQSTLMPALLQTLDAVMYPPAVVLASAQCLYTLSEDNRDVWPQIRQQSALLTCLLAVDGETSDSKLIRTLALGILLNIDADDSDQRSVGVTQCFSVLSSSLAADGRAMACTVTSNVEDQHNYPIQLRELDSLVLAQQLSIEILTELCTAHDTCESDCEVDENPAAADDDQLCDGKNGDLEQIICADDGDCQDMEEDADFGCGLSETAVPIELKEALVGGGLLRTVLLKADLPPQNVIALLEESEIGKQVHSRLRTVRNRSFLCLNNMIQCLTVSDLGGVDVLHQLWTQMMSLTLQNTECQNGDSSAFGGGCCDDTLESVAVCMRAVLDKLLGSSSTAAAAALPVTSCQLQQLTALLASCGQLEARAVLARVLGMLVCLLVRDGVDTLMADRISCVQDVCACLLQVCCTDGELQVQAEAVDALMDAMSEDWTDQIACNIGLVPRLRSLQRPFRIKVSQCGKSLGSLQPLVATVRTNLPRFIRYKATRVANLTPIPSTNGIPR